MAVNALTYIKNVGKSVSYNSFKVVKDMNPVINEFAETNKDLSMSIYKTAKDLKKNIRRMPEFIAESEYGKMGKSYLDNLMSDLKTGKFYNRERIEEAEMQGANAMMGLDDDDDTFGNLDNLDFGDLDSADEMDSNEMMDIVGEKASTAVSTAVARSAEYIVESNIQTTRATSKQLNAIYGGLHMGMSTINQNLSKFIEFSNEQTINHYENSRIFYEKTTALNEERNQLLKSISDSLTKLSEPPKQRDIKRSRYDKVVDSDGIIDFEQYFKAVKDNINDKSGGMFDMFKMMKDMGGLQTLIASPLNFVIEGMVKSVIPNVLRESMDRLNQSITGLFGNAMMALRNKADKADGGAWEFIADIFGIETNQRRYLDTSDYEKGKVPFDGITRKAITEVIPTYLSKILSALTGREEDRFDYDRGKFVSIEELVKGFRRVPESHAESAASELSKVVKDNKGKLKLSAEREKELEETWKEVVRQMYDKQITFDTRDKKLAGKFSLSGKHSDLDIKLLQNIIETYGRTANMKYAHRMYSATSDQNEEMQRMQQGGTYTALQNGSTASILGGSGIKSMIDSANGAIVDKLTAIHKEISYIRTYGLNVRNVVGVSAAVANGESPASVQGAIPSFEEFGKVIEESEIETTDTKSSNKNKGKGKKKLTAAEEAAKILEEAEKFRKEEEEKKKKKEQEEEEKNKDPKKKKNRLTFGGLTKGTKSLIGIPLTFVSSVIDKADQRLYDMIFGSKDKYDKDDSEIDEENSFLGKLLSKVEYVFDDFSGFLHEKFIDPLSEKLTKENMKDGVRKFFKLFDIDIDETIKSMKNFFFDPADGLFSDFWGNYKKSLKSIFGWGKDSVNEAAEWAGVSVNPEKTEQGKQKQKKLKNIKNQQNMVTEELARRKAKNPAAQVGQMVIDNAALATEVKDRATEGIDNTQQLASGIRRVDKTGLAVISEGEMVIPPDMNPWSIAKRERNENKVKDNLKKGVESIFEYAKGKRKHSFEKYQKKKAGKKARTPEQLLVQMAKSPKSVEKMTDEELSAVQQYLDSQKAANQLTAEDNVSGIGSFQSRIAENAVNGATYIYDEFIDRFIGDKKDTDKFKKNAFNFIEDIKEHGPTMAAAATVGAGVSVLTGLVGGPLLGAAVGAGTGLIAKSETVQEMLFGPLDPSGDRSGGLISKELSNNIKKYLPDMAKGATVGSILSILPFVPGGPVAGMILGSAVGFAKNNQSIQNELFGEDKLLGDKDKFQEKVRSVMPKIGLGALTGLLAGPFGSVTANVVLGSALGFASDTKSFKEMIFGKEGEDGKRTGGFMDQVKKYFDEKILDPLVRAKDPIKEQFKIMGEYARDAIKSVFDGIKDHIKEAFDNTIGKPLKDFAKKWFGRIFKVIGGIVATPFKAIGGIGDILRTRHIKSGRAANYMGAEQRNLYRESKGNRPFTGFAFGDKYRGVDANLADIKDNATLSDLTSLGQQITDNTLDIKKVTADATSNIQSSLKSAKIDGQIKKHVMGLVNAGHIENAIQYINESNIDSAEKAKLLDVVKKQGSRISNRSNMKGNAVDANKKIIQKMRELGMTNIDDSMAETMAKGGKTAETITNSIAQELEYRLKYKEDPNAFESEGTSGEGTKDAVKEQTEKQEKQHEEIKKFLEDIVNSLNKKNDENLADKESKLADIINGEAEAPSAVENLFSDIQEKASDIKDTYSDKGLLSAGLKTGKEILKGDLKLKGKALRLGGRGLYKVGKGIGAAAKFTKDQAHKARYSRLGKWAFGDNNRGWYNTLVSEGEEIIDATPEDVDNIPQAAEGRVPGQKNAHSLYGIWEDISKSVKRIAGTVIAQAHMEGLDTSTIPDKGTAKDFLAKIKNKFKKAGNHVTQFVNGLPIKMIRDKNGELVPDPSSSENDDNFDVINEERETQKGILSSLTAMPMMLGGLFKKLFGGDDDEKEGKSFFEKIIDFFTGDEGSGGGIKGVSLMSILGKVLPIAFAGLGLSGALNGIAQKLGLAGKGAKTTANGKELLLDENGNPVKDENGNYIATDGSIIPANTYLEKTNSTATASLDEKMKYNIARGAVTGTGSVLSYGLTHNKIYKGIANSGFGKAVGQLAKGQVDDVRYNLHWDILDGVEKWKGLLKHIPVLKNHVDKLDDLAKGLESLAGKYLTKASGIMQTVKRAILPLSVAFALADFNSGMQDASTTLRVKEETVTFPQRLVCGLIRTAKNFIPYIGTLIPDKIITDFFIDHVAGWLGIDVSAIKKQQAEAQAELDAYNQANPGQELSWEEFNKEVKGNYTFGEKIGNAVSSFKLNVKEKGFKGAVSSAITNSKVGKAVSGFATNVKEKATNALNSAKEFIQPAVTAVANTVNTFKDLGGFAFKVVRDAIREALNGKETNDTSLYTDKNDPLIDYKNIIYNSTKLLLIPVTNTIKTGKAIWDNGIKPIVDGVIQLGSSAGNTTQNIITKSWNGDLVGAMTDNSATINGDNTFLNVLSSIINGVVKSTMALPALLTTGVGFVARRIGGVIDGFKAIGSSLADSISATASSAFKGELDVNTYYSSSKDAETGNALIDGTSTIVNGVVKTLIYPVLTTVNAINRVKNAVSGFFQDMSKAGELSPTETALMEKSKAGELSPFTKEYWSINSQYTGLAGGLNWLVTAINKIFTLPSAILANFDLLDLAKNGISWLAKKNGIDDSEMFINPNEAPVGSGTRRFVGRGSGDESFISQNDPRYKNQKFNIPGDTQVQTLGNTGCAPAAAAMAINATMGSNVESMENASKNALRYKVNNDGVSADYFSDQFARHGIDTKYIENNGASAGIMQELMQQNKVVLMGQDKSNTSKENSPFGANPHYVVATGLSPDGKFIYINDPESNKPMKYNTDRILRSSSLGISAKVANGTKKLSGKIRKYIGRGTYGPDTVQYKVWNSLRNAGYNEIAVAAAMGNIQHESGFDPSKIEKGSGVGFGLVQWSYGRRTAMEEYARNKGVNPSDLSVQIEYLLMELQPNSGQWTKASSNYGLGSFTRDDWANGNDLTAATTAFMCCFERPSYDRSINHIDRRLQSAAEYYQAFTGTAIDTNLNFLPALTTNTGMSDISNNTENKPAGFLAGLTDIFSKLTAAFGLSSGSSNTGSYDSYQGINGNPTDTVPSLDGNVSSNPKFAELQKALVSKMYSVQGQLKYAQDNAKYPGSRNPEDGSGDCSSTVQWAYKNILGIDPGSWTGAQRDNANTFTVATNTLDESKLQLGDLLLKDGHVEMYAGNGKMIGHGSGYGPKVKALDKSGKYDLVRRWVGFQASGSGLPAYSNAAKYVTNSKPTSTIPLTLDFEDDKSKVIEYNANKVNASGTRRYVGRATNLNIPTSQPKANTNKDDLLRELVVQIVELLVKVVTNTDNLNQIAQSLGEYLKVVSSVGKGSEVKSNTSNNKSNQKDPTILARQNLFNTMQAAGSNDAVNPQLLSLIQSAERIARQ